MPQAAAVWGAVSILLSCELGGRERAWFGIHRLSPFLPICTAIFLNRHSICSLLLGPFPETLKCLLKAVSFIYCHFRPCWALVACSGSRGYAWAFLAVVRGGCSCCRAPALELGDAAAVAHALSCSSARRIWFPYQGLNLCPLRWQVNSQPLDHKQSP